MTMGKIDEAIELFESMTPKQKRIALRYIEDKLLGKIE